MDRKKIATDVDGLLLGDLKPGARVGDYRIEGTIAARGTGVVYRAKHLVLPRSAALKVMPSMHDWSRPLATQLLREACILEALDHPGVSRVYECGMMPDKRPWVASELVDGVTYADVLSRMMIDDRKIEPLELVTLIRDVVEVLEHVHRRGVVHCNLGTHAIVVGGNHRYPITLADWSSARTFDSTTPVPLLPQMPRPHYSPEQRVGGVIDGRTDIYALGTTAFRALYGSFPEPGMHPPMTGIPPMVGALVAQMLTREVAERPTAERLLDSAELVIAALGETFDDDDLDTLITSVVIDELADVDSSGIPLQVTDPPTAPSGRVITSDQVQSTAGEIDV
jgi:serine/threonine protein kinase